MIEKGEIYRFDQGKLGRKRTSEEKKMTNKEKKNKRRGKVEVKMKRTSEDEKEK